MRRRLSNELPLVDRQAGEGLDTEDGEARQFVTALARGLDILRAFDRVRPILGNQELAGLTGLPKATVSRLTHTLMRLGYLDYVERQAKYRLSSAVLSLGYAALGGMPLRDVARPYMQELAAFAGAPVAMGVRDRLCMVYVEACHPGTNLTFRLDVGASIPIATSAMGRALLAALPSVERNHLLAAIERRNSSSWPDLRQRIDQAVFGYADRGFVATFDEWETGVSAVGSAVIPKDGSPVAALNCGGPSFLVSRQRLVEEVGPRLAQLCRLLSGGG